ncbi:hypothetical protein AMAG_15302 [Allomyces macrogynus ATCC 38327]|uniref:Amino-acid acetyltransferase, mitochondrial n=1 Tax=Allomyces macrogynus (strain ATCC 38327) TaxID=578462 RepID=A0A0L0T8K4_ALLM3|nr:hypothetical protein AMAG_15302 [Allomyces macrogynus ATCC 38327]|eukprot:KNE71045.1 hypothetical protein AMAG_15302 [Allomyces macrogynus ATCC 38327]
MTLPLRAPTPALLTARTALRRAFSASSHFLRIPSLRTFSTSTVAARPRPAGGSSRAVPPSPPWTCKRASAAYRLSSSTSTPTTSSDPPPTSSSTPAPPPASSTQALVHRILAAGAPTPREAASYLRRYQVPPPGASQQFDVGSGAPPWLAASDASGDDSGGSSGAWPPTVVRAGPKVVVHSSTATLDRAKVVDLLESAFGRSLDVDAYFARLDKHLCAAVVAGDYAGAAIVTRESPGGCMYLDKLAVHPRQTAGGGLVDVVWRGLRDVCPKELVWRSRGNNPVNAWYFDRADGMVKLGKLPEGEKSGWTVFWYGPERVDEYVEVARGVPASFV